MSLCRLGATTAVMGAAGWLLAGLTPSPVALVTALSHAQRLADTSGADAVVLCAAGALAWLAWGWGALGLVLTTAGAAPGAVGAAARLLLRITLPAAARRATALALGVGLGLNAPLLVGTALAADPTPPAVTASATGLAVPDWPTAGPDRPAVTAPTPTAPATAAAAAPTATAAHPASPAPATSESVRAARAHVVAPGDCLWDIAAGFLRSATGRLPTDVEITDAVHAWWSANRTVIGGNPDRLFPGQVLQPPGAP